MPEDCIIEFKSEAFIQSDAEKRLADEIFDLQTMNHFGRDAKDTAQTNTDMVKEPDWDGQVPPDLIDGFDFLL